MLRGVGARVLHGGVQVHRVKQQCVGGGVVLQRACFAPHHMEGI